MSKKLSFIANLLAIAFLLSNSVYALPEPKNWSNNEWYQYFEATSAIMLGDAQDVPVKAAIGRVSPVPLTDVYAALSAAGSATSPALLSWLKNKMIEAHNAGDMDRGDLYQAYYSSLATGDNAKLKDLLSKLEAKKNQVLQTQKGSTQRPETAVNVGGGDRTPANPASSYTHWVTAKGKPVTIDWSGPSAKVGKKTYVGTFENGSLHLHHHGTPATIDDPDIPAAALKQACEKGIELFLELKLVSPTKLQGTVTSPHIYWDGDRFDHMTNETDPCVWTAKPDYGVF